MLSLHALDTHRYIYAPVNPSKHHLGRTGGREGVSHEQTVYSTSSRELQVLAAVPALHWPIVAGSHIALLDFALASAPASRALAGLGVCSVGEGPLESFARCRAGPQAAFPDASDRDACVYTLSSPVQ